MYKYLYIYSEIAARSTFFFLRCFHILTIYRDHRSTLTLFHLASPFYTLDTCYLIRVIRRAAFNVTLFFFFFIIFVLSQ